MSSLAALTLPTVGAELWRYSRIGELDLGSYAIGLADTTVTSAVGALGSDSHIALADVSSEAPDVSVSPSCSRIP